MRCDSPTLRSAVTPPAPKIRRVSLFTREGNFNSYVMVAGTPRVVLFEGGVYLAFDTRDTFGITNSFREVESEEGAR